MAGSALISLFEPCGTDRELLRSKAVPSSERLRNPQCRKRHGVSRAGKQEYNSIVGRSLCRTLPVFHNSFSWEEYTLKRLCCPLFLAMFLLFTSAAAAADFTGIWAFSGKDGTEYSFDLLQNGSVLEGTFSAYDSGLDKYREAGIEGSAGGSIATVAVNGGRGILTMDEEDLSVEWTLTSVGKEKILPPSGTVLPRDFAAIGFRLLSGEKLFVLEDAETEKEILKLLGKPEKKTKAEEWGADGLIHQKWLYGKMGIAVDFVREGTSGTGKADSVTLSAPSRKKTSRGIGIGSLQKEVLEAYGAEFNREESLLPDTIIAGSVFGGLVFTMKDGRVESIFIGAAAE